MDPANAIHMALLLAHRGPDGSSSWSDGSVGFGARILHSAPVPLPVPRLIARDGDGLVVVADARIDNRQELAASLDLRRPLQETPDEELILAAYRAWGQDAPGHLLGDFVFAIWDNERRALFCARDPFGVRPFCYHLSNRLFAFASEIKALFCVPEVPRSVDEVRVAFFLDNFIDDPEGTFYRDIYRLPAGHFLEVTPSGMRRERYWSLDADREVRCSSDEQYAESFRELFFEAVRCRLRDANPIGATLSGGLDSSSIVLAASRLLAPDRSVHAFSAVFPGLPDGERESNDESGFIDAVVQAERVVSHRVRADRVAPLDDYDRVFRHLDSPPLAFNLYLNLILYAAMEREGVRVFLDGMDGDSVVSNGYERFIDLVNEARWSTVVEETMALTRRYETPSSWFPNHHVYPQLTRLARAGRWKTLVGGSNAIAKGLGRSRLKVLRSGTSPLFPNRARGLHRRRMEEEPRRPLIREEFARRTRLRERERAYFPYDSPPDSAREDHARVLSLPRYQFAMELIGGTAAAFGCEARFPFFDRRLVEFCVAIPPEQKLADGWTRLIQRRAMEGILPPLIQWRVHKGNLSFSFMRGMREVEAPKLDAILSRTGSALAEFVDMDALRSARDRLLSSESSEQANDDAMQIYKAIVLARWLADYGAPAA